MLRRVAAGLAAFLLAVGGLGTGIAADGADGDAHAPAARGGPEGRTEAILNTATWKSVKGAVEDARAASAW